MVVLDDEWRARHFDHLSPDFAEHLHEVLAAMRADHPVTWSEEHGGFWVVTRYEDVLRVAQDWRTFSSVISQMKPATRAAAAGEGKPWKYRLSTTPVLTLKRARRSAAQAQYTNAAIQPQRPSPCKAHS